ncbi:MAG: hypothetical protein HY731_05245, partial [Candidatus Tectomicrobia bacterium]|nr:hypothetical protein [Candidatus Tectomicrobia bacterium]
MREALEYYLMRLKNSHLHWLWDLLIASSVAFVAVERPARFVLGYDVHAGLASADWVITSVLFVDMLLHMRHPVSISKVTPRSPAAGASSRVWWFMIDLLAAIPFRIFPGTMLLQLLQVVKLARVAQFMRQWQQNEVQNVNILRLGFFAFWLLLTAHWLACGWLALGGINMEADRFTRYLRALYWC